MSHDVPIVRFLCLHDAGHTQMALGFFNHLAAGRAIAWVGDGGPGAEVNPEVIAAMAEVGIDITKQVPAAPETRPLRVTAVVVATSCGGDCSIFLAERYEDWKLADLGGPIATIRPVRDEIERRVRLLLSFLGVSAGQITSSAS